jgi:hypothetical protein
MGKEKKRKNTSQVRIPIRGVSRAPRKKREYLGLGRLTDHITQPAKVLLRIESWLP